MNARRFSSGVLVACLCTTSYFRVSAPVAVLAGEAGAQPAKADGARLHRESLRRQVELFNPEAMRLAIADLSREFPERYADAAKLLRKLDVVAKGLPGLGDACMVGEPDAIKRAEELLAFQKSILLGSPALDFKDILLIRRGLGAGARHKMGRGIGMPSGNFSTMSDTQRKGWDNEIVVLEDFLQGNAVLRTVYKPKHGGLVSDVDLHVSGERLMFSAVNERGVWRLFEKPVSGGTLTQLSPDDGDDIDHYDACYLPNGEVAFTSTATFLGMPCIDGQPRMASIYRLNPQNKKIDQLCFEQDSDWCPTVMNDGRIMYLRWEYADMVHSNNRIVMSMNPDGTSQKSYYGSNSYFPNSFFYARPIPGDASRIVGIATGHHGLSRSGRMLVLDPQLGTREAEGVVREIPRRGKKVVAEVKDRLVDGVWPQILHPFPLAEKSSHRGAGKYFLVSMKPKADSLWGIYLVDIFDNITLIKEMEGQGLFEPVPLRRREEAPIIADRVDPEKTTATVYIQDIYHGPGLDGVPRGEVKTLRVGSYHFSPHGSGGLIGTLGMDGPWDIKRVLGTVPVFKDGSTTFEIPANTPVFLQPLDKDGQALQTMRSWFVGRPGERVSCVGCHESSRDAPQPKMSLASTAQPYSISPWLGEARPFSFRHEIQPILERKCNSCHDGKVPAGRYESRRLEYRNKTIPHFNAELIDDWDMTYSGRAGANYAGRFSKAYGELHRFVRRAGIESDMRVLTAKEFSADTTELVQLLRKGHHGVKLDDDEWSRLICWIDFNAPYHGYRKDVVGGVPKKHKVVQNSIARANELSRKYAGVVSFHHYQAPEPVKPEPVMPDQSKQSELRRKGVLLASFKPSKERKAAQSIDLGQGQKIKLVYIPAGSFNMGSGEGALDELPMSQVKILKGFFMAEAEVSNAQMRCFDSAHDSRDESWKGYQFGMRGYDMNKPEMPAVRLSWEKAMAFCRWLSEKTGRKVTLPTEAQWEWACHATKPGPFWYGAMGSDFAAYANLADRRISELVIETASDPRSDTKSVIIENPGKSMDYIPKDATVDDGHLLPRLTMAYQSNPWGLYDMHGNVAEWTRSRFEAYPYAEDGRNDIDGDRTTKRVVRGGSWHDRPYRATASYRLTYPQYQRVFNVGFRVIIEQ
ncbi:MAG: SUMF1/EgtB/PvdO family nonheme iron enzyme [Verrucomicrobiota bacterium]